MWDDEVGVWWGKEGHHQWWKLSQEGPRSSAAFLWTAIAYSNYRVCNMFPVILMKWNQISMETTWELFSFWNKVICFQLESGVHNFVVSATWGWRVEARGLFESRSSWDQPEQHIETTTEAKRGWGLVTLTKVSWQSGCPDSVGRRGFCAEDQSHFFNW